MELNIWCCLYFLHYEDYAEANLWAEKINRKGLLWDPLFRAATLGLLNRNEDGNKAYKELLVLSPQFPKKAKEMVNLYILDKKLQEQILRGLALAGMK